MTNMYIYSHFMHTSIFNNFMLWYAVFIICYEICMLCRMRFYDMVYVVKYMLKLTVYMYVVSFSRFVTFLGDVYVEEVMKGPLHYTN